jgi:asparagine synthase (glutamine-hydrolysing)
MHGATVAIARHAWEGEIEPRHGAHVFEDATVSLVADASIYYRDDLAAALAPRGYRLTSRATAGDAILAAYRAWGDDAPRRLEGDFAFVLWDRARQRLVCARDYGGKRPLYYAMVGNTLVVASSIGIVAAAPRFEARLNVAVLAETCAQFWSGSDETCYVGVRELPAGATLTWLPGTQPIVTRHWEVPNVGGNGRARIEEGAETLRSLLIRATKERLSHDGPTAVWMSGGWDSSAVFASANAARAESADERRRVIPVSISYPEGDPGREDELIAAIARHWHAPVQWLEVDRIPLLANAEARAADRDLPAAHTYELWNRALANASRASGARVAFDGNGGDQLFQISDVFLSDLFRGGRLASVIREWRKKGGRGAGTFFDWVIAPALPGFAKDRVVKRLGRRSADDFMRPIPAWIRGDFVARHALRDREQRHLPRRDGYRGWRREAHLFLSAPVFPRAFQCLAGLALEAGVELRSPLYDRRVIEFACSRSREERNSGRETKRLLRASMRGLVPDAVLAPRPHRTGITTAYSDRRMRSEFPVLLARHGKMQMLADLGIVEPEAMRRGWEEYCRTGDTSIKIPLYLTMQVELWLQARARQAPAPAIALEEKERFYAIHD